MKEFETATRKTAAEIADDLNREAKAKGKYLELPHEGGTIVLGAHAVRQRAAELRQQQEQSGEEPPPSR